MNIVLINDATDAEVSVKISKIFGCNSGIKFHFMFFSFLLLTPASHARQEDKSIPNDAVSGFVLLGLVGYNYTNRNISEYSVNGASGGYINLSSPTSGGSGVTCCVRMLKKSPAPIQVRVRWQVDGCVLLESNPRTGAKAERRVFYFKDADVDVQIPNNTKLKFIETHFYPDGTIQVKLTEHGSDPFPALDEKRADKSYFPICKNDKNGK
ncbi:MAG: DUF3304 domain-containing protein [Proteobacteria bacterium]|nr:MAG: DUF3304 domain-containing protein [Pseudomonadota bacterium]